MTPKPEDSERMQIKGRRRDNKQRQRNRKQGSSSRQDVNGSRVASYNKKECESQGRYHISNRHKTAFMNNPASSNTESTFLQ